MVTMATTGSEAGTHAGWEFLADHRKMNRPEDVVRAVLTFFWAAGWLSSGSRTPIGDSYDPDSDGFAVVSLLYQTGVGSIRDLVRRYYAGPELFARAREMVTGEALLEARNQLLGRLPVLQPVLAECLRDVMFLVEPGSRKFRPEARDRLDPEVLRELNKGLLTAAELDGRTAIGVRDRLASVLSGATPLRVRARANLVWVETREALHTDPPAFSCRMTSDGSRELGCHTRLARGDPDRPSTENEMVICLNEDVIAIAADLAALAPEGDAGWVVRDSIARRAAKLLGATGDAVADEYRRVLREFVYRHEVGHDRMKTRLKDLRHAHEELDGSRAFRHNASEMLADAYALGQLPNELDGPWAEMLAGVVAHETRGCLDKPLPARLEPPDEDEPPTVLSVHRVFRLRALLVARGDVWLFDQVRDATSALEGRDEEEYEAWLLGRCEEVRQEIVQILSSDARA